MSSRCVSFACDLFSGLMPILGVSQTCTTFAGYPPFFLLSLLVLSVPVALSSIWAGLWINCWPSWHQGVCCIRFWIPCFIFWWTFFSPLRLLFFVIFSPLFFASIHFVWFSVLIYQFFTSCPFYDLRRFFLNLFLLLPSQPSLVWFPSVVWLTHLCTFSLLVQLFSYKFVILRQILWHNVFLTTDNDDILRNWACVCFLAEDVLLTALHICSIASSMTCGTTIALTGNLTGFPCPVWWTGVDLGGGGLLRSAAVRHSTRKSFILFYQILVY